MKKWMALGLALLLVILLLAACSNQTAVSEPAQSAEEAAQAAAEAPAEEAGAPTQAEPAAAQTEPTSQEPTSAEPIEEQLEPEGSQAEAQPENEEPQIAVDLAQISYPFDEEVAFSVFYAINSGFNAVISSWTEAPTLPYLKEQIGVNFDFIEPSEMTASEQFNLIIASGEYPDYFNSNMYNGGVSQAYTDDVILELTDMVPDNMPDYWAVMQQQEVRQQKNAYNDEGQMLCVASITHGGTLSGGMIVRQDMLEGVGKEIPTTTDELYDTLLAVKNAYNTEHTFFVQPDGELDSVTGAFEIVALDLSGMNTSLAYYLEGDTVKSALQSDGYKDYLEYFIKLYQEGLIYQDFYSMQISADLMNNVTFGGAACMWESMGDTIDSTTAAGSAETPGFQLTAMGYITQQPGDTYTFGEILSTVSSSGTCISTTCEQPDKALQVINWFYTEPGQLYSAVGVEGMSFEYSADGQIVFTDAVLNTPGMTKTNALNLYCMSPVGSYGDRTYAKTLFSEKVQEAEALWSDVDSSSTLPSVSLTSEENDRYASPASDIYTVACEQLLKYMVGTEALTDESWQAFQARLQDMGLEDCVEIYQDAFDRYLER